MLKRTLLTALAAVGTLAFTASAQAAYLSLGTSNSSNATTTLSGNPAGAELVVKNSNGSSAAAFGLYGLRTATAPTATSAAVRGHNSSTNALGYGVWGSQNGSGTGVYGFAPSGKGIRGESTSGIGVSGLHNSTSASNVAGVQGQSAGLEGTGVKGIATSGSYAKGVWGVSSSGYGGYFESLGPSGWGLYSTGTEFGVAAESASGIGVRGHSGSNAGVAGESDASDGVSGVAHKMTTAGVSGDNDAGGYGVWGGSTSSGTGIYGTSPFGEGVSGASSSGFGVYGDSTNKVGVLGQGHTVGVEGEGGEKGVSGISQAGDGVFGSSSSTGTAVYGSNPYGNAGYFYGHVTITGGCTGCAGAALKIDHPLDPAHKYLQHATVISPQMKGIYDGVVRTNAKGFATVRMPRYFQALNRSFRYQLTVVGKPGQFVQAMIVKEVAHDRFTLETSKPNVKVSWQVTGIRHDRFAKAYPIRVVAPKSKKDQGKYLHPELYGKPRSDGIGYQKPPRAPHKPVVKR